MTNRRPIPAAAGEASRPGRRAKPWGAAIVAVLLAAYAWGQPLLNDQLGWNLPSVQLGSREPATSNDRSSTATAGPDQAAAAPVSAHGAADSSPAAAASADLSPSAAASAPAAADSAAATTRSAPQSAATEADVDLEYGLLLPQGNQRFRSPAGLLYTAGSAEGHRLKHLQRHTVDDPDRPGPHGVFDGGMEGALATIDRAYQKAKTGVQTTTREERGRTIYTVDLGSRVGYVGGQEGQRRRKPMARRVRLVLEDNRVITAFPL